MFALRLFLLIMGVSTLSAQTISFFSTLRAGRFAGADWEMGVGNTSSASTSTQSFNYLGFPGNNHWGSSNVNHNFRMGWNATTNSAYVSVWNANNAPTTATYTVPGVPLGPNATWTLPIATFFLSAAALSQPTSIQIQNVALSPGVQILSGPLPSNVSLSQSGSPAFFANSAPIVFNPAAAGGSWYLSGQIRFTGLESQGGLARNSQLQFMMNAVGTSSAVPEASTWSMMGLGLAALVALRRRARGIAGA